MRRRTLIAGFGAVTSVLLLSGQTILAQARMKVARIGLLGNTRGTPQPLLDGLRERGWEPGRFRYRGTLGRGTARALSRTRSRACRAQCGRDFCPSPPAVRAAQQATRTIPIIMFAVATPSSRVHCQLIPPWRQHHRGIQHSQRGCSPSSWRRPKRPFLRQPVLASCTIRETR